MEEIKRKRTKRDLTAAIMDSRGGKIRNQRYPYQVPEADKILGSPAKMHSYFFAVHRGRDLYSLVQMVRLLLPDDIFFRYFWVSSRG